MGRELTFAEYFAGIGLVRLGLEPLGWKVRFANDIDRKKYEMYSQYFGNDEDEIYRVDDIHSLAPDSIPWTLLATSSFPCIDLSVAGNQKGLNGKHSRAFWGLLRILEGMGSNRRPPLVLLENVLGWLTASKRRDFPESVAALNRLGYVCDAFILNANHFVPQSRPRLFVVGAQHRAAIRDADIRLRLRPAPLRSKRLVDTVANNSELQWMALDLPEPPAQAENQLGDVIERMGARDDRWWSREKVDHILNQMNSKHLRVAQESASADEIQYATVYKRVREGQTRAEIRSDGIAGCLRTPVGGSSKQIVMQAGKGELKFRWMTAREYARLQGVGDEYPIQVPYLQALWGFGDAVCAPAVSWIAEHALKPLAEEL